MPAFGTQPPTFVLPTRSPLKPRPPMATPPPPQFYAFGYAAGGYGYSDNYLDTYSNTY